nr:MAG: RNA-dependent RNA polymerase [Avian astrovirus 7]
MNVDSICYGDDRLLAVNSTFLDYDPNDIPPMYKDIFGMWVKPENIKIGQTCEGMSFCGMTAREVDGLYIGLPNVNKILSTFEFPVKALPDVQALWGKLISLRILCQYADPEVLDYLNKQMARVKEYALAENIELPEVPRDFYKTIWTGGPNKNDG